jgi:hypothetical protein
MLKLIHNQIKYEQKLHSDPTNYINNERICPYKMHVLVSSYKKKKKHKQGNSSRMENRFQLNINRGIVQEWKIASS